MGWSIKKPLGGKKSVFRQVANVAAAPVKVVAAPVLQAAGLKKLASEVNDGLISKGALKTAGTITQVAGLTAAAVVAAPAAYSLAAKGVGLGAKLTASGGLLSRLFGAKPAAAVIQGQGSGQEYAQELAELPASQEQLTAMESGQEGQRRAFSGGAGWLGRPVDSKLLALAAAAALVVVAFILGKRGAKK